VEIVLIGAGNMGSAMVAGLSQYNLVVVDKNEEKLKVLKKKYPHITTALEAPNVEGKVILLAVKPQVLKQIKLGGKAKALVSILAGVSLARLKEQIEAEFYIRAMPNVAAMYQKSITSAVGDSAFKKEAIEILSSIGKVVWLESEKELDIATALAASSPAWLAIVAEALVDGAVNLGLRRDKALEYMPMLFEGVGAVLDKKHPALFKDIVTSPGGTTIAGVASLEKDGIRSAFIEAMKECYTRAKEL
jgi:pyrroline-5-carboxylate reductase